METRARYALIGVFTLGVIVAAFGFAYWLRSGGGFAERAIYQVRFESPVTGLVPGSSVLFNGIRVGEVTSLELDSANPSRVMATIAVGRTTPVRSDTQVGIDTQGFLGEPALTLRGGMATSSPAEVQGGVGVLEADPAATESLSHAAREALRRFDSLIAENAQPLHDTITNLSTFAGALARNSNRVDTILASLERLGGGPAKAPVPVYDLTAPRDFPQLEKAPNGQLVVPEPTALVLFDTQKILVRLRDTETVALDAQWSDSLPKLLQTKIIQSFENAGYMRAVARPLEGLTADYQLLIDVRSFQVVMIPEPRAEVEFTAKILAADGRIIDARLLHAHTPIAAADPPMAAAGLDAAFGKASTDLVLWTLGSL
ncbi:ABC-type transport auxiliary lipoprotein family protein [Microvirga massiliensis]|uniref:ABC-type transport auxiliary lipoprotein family protein n=1 Tax=Microvirga massiliensis TaxID=1033741 RepID=UPI00062BD4D8|nr:ABC-type transport auxiliary lipoprotein family protein [Microvirga massiliensis]